MLNIEYSKTPEHDIIQNFILSTKRATQEHDTSVIEAFLGEIGQEIYKIEIVERTDNYDIEVWLTPDYFIWAKVAYKILVEPVNILNLKWYLYKKHKDNYKRDLSYLCTRSSLSDVIKTYKNVDS